MVLPPVESDELFVARGMYRQQQRRQPTDIHESWTMHILPDDATIWRSHLVYADRMLLSACYLLRDPALRPVQMVFYWRWQDGREDMIEYRFMPRHVTIVYRGQEQDMILPPNYEVYGWHTITENMLWAGYDYQQQGQQTLRVMLPGIHNGTLWPTIVPMNASFSRNEILPGPDGPLQAKAFILNMPELGPQTLHFDSFGIPLRWTQDRDQFEVNLVEYSRTDEDLAEDW